jgi:hypothetical protein
VNLRVVVFSVATDTTTRQAYVDQILVTELKRGDVVVFDNLKPSLMPRRLVGIPWYATLLFRRSMWLCTLV